MIKLKTPLLLGLTMSAIALTATPTFSQSTSASTKPFQCGRIGGKLTTFVYSAETSNAKTQEKTALALIHWENENISQDIDIPTACHNAATTLNNYSDSGKREFKTLVDGTNFGSKIVVCLINASGKCNQQENKAFFTLKPEAEKKLDTVLLEIIDPNLANLDLKDLNDPKFRAIGRIYYPTIKPISFWDRILGRY